MASEGKNLVGVLEEDPRGDRIVAIDVKAPTTSGPKTRMYPVDLTAPASETVGVTRSVMPTSLRSMVWKGLAALPEIGV